MPTRQDQGQQSRAARGDILDAPIRYGAEGRIRAGANAGYTIKIIENELGHPDAGYLLLIYDSATGIGYDYWAENAEWVEGFFNNEGWVVDWD